ncbi:MAG TPA: hypothetical protein H9751_01490 [Candidatus Corynebacterium faecigallinarum]|uniref:Uncharacterized protein n=1 Tax=Candidatus Corynebacterium faecigallinarum TaxID=2838528 RepID=A0A9D2QB22_9CORY|nr:hypothetical protein [Candidatus Corynebacterium faecigallinarum]
MYYTRDPGGRSVRRATGVRWLARGPGQYGGA